MLPPVRCFTCGRPLGHLWPRFRELVASGKTPGEALDELGVDRYCCRRTLFTSVTYIEHAAKYRVGIPVPPERLKMWG
ncbi:DNA-directed RNA polymerase subunit N [Aeropyrum pernix]|uniref:DNA-directed RNA polymerase subunit Rpo10 n=1 Tax=Aeropyrum pernix TaxID=56636 RepID=A0A401H8H2_AERPX|nr:DNA-directed RNA polymerase subunit N [Aeropyrum pernix]GBF08704.1 DNA-directed RNA polymerase subunit N [Aeropyrum pernix]